MNKDGLLVKEGGGQTGRGEGEEALDLCGAGCAKNTR